jgi:putative transposase
VSDTIERYQISERRACRLAGISRSSRRYQAAADHDDALGERLRELARERQRFGHLRLTVLLRREDWIVNHKKVYRICREEQLLVPRRRRKRIRHVTHAEQPALERANQSWAMDFMQDGLADGRTLRILTIIDRYTREALALEVDTSIPYAFGVYSINSLLSAVVRRRSESITALSSLAAQSTPGAKNIMCCYGT